MFLGDVEFLLFFLGLFQVIMANLEFGWNWFDLTEYVYYEAANYLTNKLPK